MNWFTKLAVLYLVALLAFVWGVGVGFFEWWPHAAVKTLVEYGEGHELEQESTFFEKLENDLGVKPTRHLREVSQEAGQTTPLEVPGLASRRDKPGIYIHPDHREGYRALFGAMDFQETFWGGLLLGPDGEVLHRWTLSTDHLPTATTTDNLKNLYGMHLYPDGSIIFTMQERGGGIVKVNACSEIQWNLEGEFHHTISPDGTGHFWTYHDKQTDFDHTFARVSEATGEIVQTIDMRDVRAANPHKHFFNLQKVAKQIDISHGNDIDPLPAELADRFEGFETGDLLISYRTQNLVFVLDPDTLEVKWWRVGAWAKQHDPDWHPGGYFTVFSNNHRDDLATLREHSDIIAIDPVSLRHQVILDGDRYDFYSQVNGMQTTTPWDTLLVTSTNQGWIFEVDEAGEVVFSFVNNYKVDEGRSLNVSDAHRYPAEWFSEPFWERCP